jgi:hypothetical protein
MSVRPLDPVSRHQLDDQLRKNVEDARAQYESAKARVQGLMEASRDLGITNPDGNQAIRNAIRKEELAISNYTDAVYALSKFVLDGHLPRLPRSPRGGNGSHG